MTANRNQAQQNAIYRDHPVTRDPAETFNNVVAKVDTLVKRIISLEENIPIDEGDYKEIVHSTTVPLTPFDGKKFEGVGRAKRTALNNLVKIFWILMVVIPPIVFIATATERNGPCTYVAHEPAGKYKLYSYDDKSYVWRYLEKTRAFDRRSWCETRIQISYLYKWYVDLSLLGNSFKTVPSLAPDTCGYIEPIVNPFGLASANDPISVATLNATGIYAGTAFVMVEKKTEGSIYACTMLPIVNRIMGYDSSVVAEVMVLVTIILTLFHFAYGPETGRTSSFVFCVLALDKLSGFSYSLAAYYLTLLFTWGLKNLVISARERYEGRELLKTQHESVDRI